MNKSKGKAVTIFLCVLIALLFVLSVTFTLIKNDLRAKEKYYNEQNQIIKPIIDEED